VTSIPPASYPARQATSGRPAGTPVEDEKILVMIEYPPGTPCWVDLASPDIDASERFYGELFGWQTRAMEGPPEETLGYRMFTLGGADVAGIGPADGRPPAWSTYVAVDYAVTTKERVESVGGTTVMEPTTVMDAGTSAIFADPGGALLAVWQPERHRGAQLVNAPGALTMNELATRDLQGAELFYGHVFGWDFEPLEIEGRVQYGFFKLDGRTVASVLPMGDAFPAEVPPHWVPYFGIDDLDGALELARRLGAQVLAGPNPVPEGRFVALRDPHGAVFSIWEGSYDAPPG
jgi:predicted enzyme related to lactoylglutathione lyase